MAGKHSLAPPRRTGLRSVGRTALAVLAFAAVFLLHALSAGEPILALFSVVVVLGSGFWGLSGGLLFALAASGATAGLLGWRAIPYAVTFLSAAVASAVLMSGRNRALRDKMREYEALAAEHVAAYENFERYREKKEALDRRLLELTALQGATSALVATTDLEGIYATIVDTAAKLCACDTAALFLLEEASDSLVVKEGRGSFAPWENGETLELAKGVTGWVARHGQPELVRDLVRDPRFQATVKESQFKSYLAVPLVVESHVVGVLGVGRVDDPDLSRDELFLISGLASQATMALHRAYLHGELERLAITDGLTGLFNRRYFEETLKKETVRATRYQGRYSILLLDVDHFKNYNDKNGHPAGDRLLAQVAEIMRRSVREIDVACRYGGEEFVVVLPETDAEAAQLVAERIRSSVENLQFEGAKLQPLGRLSASLGIACLPAHGRSGEEVLRAADAALYAAKSEGRNRCVVARR